MKNLLKLLTLPIALYLLSSCIDDKYDLGEVDMTIQIGGNSLAFPLLNKDQIRVDILMSSFEMEDLIESSEDGSYALSMTDNLDFAKSLPDFRESINFKGSLVDYTKTIPLSKAPISTQKRLASSPISYKLDHKIPADIGIDTKDIISLKVVEIENAFFKLEFDLEALANASMTMKIEFPKIYVFKEGQENLTDNIYEDKNATFEDGKYEMPILELKSLDFSDKIFNQGGDNDFKDTILLSCNLNIDIPTSGVLPSSPSLILTASATEFSLVSAVGRADLEIGKTRQTLVLDEVPEFLRSEGTVLDLLNPHLLFELNSNAGFPVNGTLKIVPYITVDGKKEEVTDAIQVVPFNLPKSMNPKVTLNVKYWIAKNDENMPKGEDYEFILSENLPKMFKRLPDSIIVFMDGDLDVNQDHIIDVNANYVANGKYELKIPFSFGSEFQIALADTIDIPSVISDLLDDRGLELFGEIENSIPLELELKMSALDENDNKIELATTKNTIKSASSTGDSVKSPIEISLKREKASESKITRLIMSFKTTSPNTSEDGALIEGHDFIIADIKVRIPDGITVDLNDTTK